MVYGFGRCTLNNDPMNAIAPGGWFSLSRQCCASEGHCSARGAPWRALDYPAPEWAGRTASLGEVAVRVGLGGNSGDLPVWMSRQSYSGLSLLPWRNSLDLSVDYQARETSVANSPVRGETVNAGNCVENGGNKLQYHCGTNRDRSGKGERSHFFRKRWSILADSRGGEIHFRPAATRVYNTRTKHTDMRERKRFFSNETSRRTTRSEEQWLFDEQVLTLASSQLRYSSELACAENTSWPQPPVPVGLMASDSRSPRETFIDRCLACRKVGSCCFPRARGECEKDYANVCSDTTKCWQKFKFRVFDSGCRCGACVLRAPGACEQKSQNPLSTTKNSQVSVSACTTAERLENDYNYKRKCSLSFSQAETYIDNGQQNPENHVFSEDSSERWKGPKCWHGALGKTSYTLQMFGRWQTRILNACWQEKSVCAKKNWSEVAGVSAKSVMVTPMIQVWRRVAKRVLAKEMESSGAWLTRCRIQKEYKCIIAQNVSRLMGCCDIDQSYGERVEEEILDNTLLAKVKKDFHISGHGCGGSVEWRDQLRRQRSRKEARLAKSGKANIEQIRKACTNQFESQMKKAFSRASTLFVSGVQERAAHEHIRIRSFAEHSARKDRAVAKRRKRKCKKKKMSARNRCF